MAEQLHYADHRPYPAPPSSLTELHGPTAGVIELPIAIDWGPRRTYDLAKDADRRIVYEVVLQEATSTDELAQYIDGMLLTEVWARLWLPRRVRDAWQERFPQLDRST